MSLYDPASGGELNLDRAQRWIWNYSTFLTNEASTAWKDSPICFTFTRENLQELLSDRNDSISGVSIPSAGIRFTIGMHAEVD